VNTTPSSNKFTIRSLVSNTLDSNNRFKWNPVSTSLQAGIYNATVTLDGSTTNLSPPAFTVSTTQDLNAVPDGGFKDVTLYKAAYADGSFIGSYTSLIAGDSCTNRQLTNRQSVTFDLTGTSPSIGINSLNLIPGLKYTLLIYVKSNIATPITVSLEYTPSQYYRRNNDPTNSDFMYLSGDLTNSFTSIMWTFIAVAPKLCFRINNAGATPLTIEFSALSIQGGMDGPVLPLACTNGVTTNGILNVCK
jgi:hypothetical protein